MDLDSISDKKKIKKEIKINLTNIQPSLIPHAPLKTTMERVLTWPDENMRDSLVEFESLFKFEPQV